MMIDRQNESTAFSAKALLAWGLEDFAYVRPAMVEGKPAYMICAADGAEIVAFDDREVAFAACRQNELEPLSVH
jgi:hypothetical protein